MAQLYQIQHTDGVRSITIQPGTTNGPGGVLTNTDLQLHGQGTLNWGKGVDQNQLRLLENFACPESILFPGNPMNEAEIGVPGAGINFPVIGQSWFNTDTNVAYSYNGTSWIVTNTGVGTFLPLSGGVVSGPLTVNATLVYTAEVFGSGNIQITKATPIIQLVATGGTQAAFQFVDDTAVLRAHLLFDQPSDTISLVKADVAGTTATNIFTLYDTVTISSQKITTPSTVGGDSGLTLTTKDYVDTTVAAGGAFTPVEQGGGAGQGTNKVHIGWDGASIRLQVDATSFAGAWPMTIALPALYGGTSQPAQRFESVEFNAPTTNTTFIASHGMGRVPDVVRTLIRCKAAEHGYVVNEEIDITCYDYDDVGTPNFRFGKTSATSTQCFYNWAKGGSAPTIFIHTKSTQIPVNITPGNWKLIFRAISF